jgi:hypothetical protein
MEDQVLNQLKELTKHAIVKLTNCGNSAVFAAFCIAKKLNSKPFILIPDQGGWLSYKTYPKMINFEVKEIKTDHALIDLEDLKKKAKTGAAFIVPSLGGYFVQQDMEAIAKICKEAGCLVIEDASGGIGIPGLCNGRHADFIVGSFGRWKNVGVGHGGFISATENHFKDLPVMSMTKHHIDLEMLKQKLDALPQRLDFLFTKAENIKNDLSKYSILHRFKKGLNVLVKWKDENEKKEIVQYCTTNNLEYSLCPRYIRVEDNAVSIEVKRLNVGDPV